MSKRILAVVSEFGYWGEEAVGPLETLENAGYTVDFATPKGKRPVAISVSMDPDYVDPPLGRSVTSPEMAEKVKALEASDRLDDPINLSELMPERPYRSSENFLREQEAYFNEVDRVRSELLDKYD